MSKRGATQQLSKEGNFFGDGSNEMSDDDKPRQATAAQLANRKLKPLKGRPRAPGSTMGFLDILHSIERQPPPKARSVPRPRASAGPQVPLTRMNADWIRPDDNSEMSGMASPSAAVQAAAPVHASAAVQAFAHPAPAQTAPANTAAFGMAPLAAALPANPPFIPATAQSFPPATQQPAGANSFPSFSPAPPTGTFNFSAAPAANPFSSQNPASNTANFSNSFPFGNSDNNAPQNTMFGGNNSVSGASNPFGNLASAPANGPFGGTTSTSAPSTSGFGTTSPAPSSITFGGANTSSAPSSITFGGANASSAPSSNLFSTSSAQSNAFPSNPSGSTNNAFAAGSAAPSGITFGGTSSAAPASNAFPPASASAPSANLFGASTSTAPTNVFGMAASAAPSTNLFGSTTPSKPPSNTFFGSTTPSAPPNNNLFGGSTTPSAPSTNLFNGSTTPSSAPTNNLFSGATASSAPSNNLFGSGMPSSAPSGVIASPGPVNLFGGSPSTTSSAPTNAVSTIAPAPSANNFGPPPAYTESASQPANTFAQPTSSFTPPANNFGFGNSQPSSATSGPGTNATANAEQSSTNNVFSQSASSFKPPSGGNNLFGFPTQSPSKPAAETPATADLGTTKDTLASTDAPSKPPTNPFGPSTSNGASQPSSTSFNFGNQSPLKPTSTSASTPGANVFGLAGQSAPTTTSESATQEDTQKSTGPKSSSTVDLFAKAASATTTPSAGPSLFGQSGAPKDDKPAAASSPSSTNPFGSIAPSSPGNSTAVPALNASSATANASTDAKLGSPAKPSSSMAQSADTPTSNNFDMRKVDPKNVDTAVSIRALNRWLKSRLSMMSDDGDCAAITEIYLEHLTKLTSENPGSGTSAQTQSKSNGKRKAEDDLEPSDVVGAGSPKKSKVQPSQGDNNAASASDTANIFNSIVSKPTQSPLRNVESATSPDTEAGPSGNSLFGASSSTPLKFGASGGVSGSTTPVGSPAKPNTFSAQSPLKAPSFGQPAKANGSKRNVVDISSDDQEEESQDDSTQQEKRQKTSPPESSADTGSVLNSRQASPDARNIFGHLSQDESNKGGDEEASDEDEDGEQDQGSTTPKDDSKRTGGLFGRISKDDTPSSAEPKTPEAEGLLGRITGTSSESSKTATANPFGFSSTTYEVPGGAKAGPVLKTWNGDSESPIKFGSSQPAKSGDDKSGTTSSTSTNPFASLPTSGSAAPAFKFTPASTPPASDPSPFKFNPPAATPSGSSSVFASGFGSRATTPGLSTGASENETSAAENDDDEDAQTIDNDQVALRTGLTEEDKATYDVLFDTDSEYVTMMRLVDKSEEELKADPKKGPKKWERQGMGPLRVLKHKQTGGISILLKAEPMGRVLINTRVQSSFSYRRAKAKVATFPLPDGEGKILTQYLKFEDDAECIKFAEICEQKKSS